MAASEARVGELKKVERNASSNGIVYRHLNQEEVHEKASWIDASATGRNTFFPGDGYVDPYLLSHAYGRAARKRGVQIRKRTEVDVIVVDAETAKGVGCASGTVSGGSDRETVG